MKLMVCSKVCRECPFSNKSLKGWLGPASVDTMLEFQQNEGLFSCHLQRGEDPEQNLEEITDGKQRICRGYMISAKLSCKSFGQNPETGKALKELSDTLEISEEEKETILKRWEFKKYHTFAD